MTSVSSSKVADVVSGEIGNGQSSRLQIQRSGFDARRYQIF
jgi:hypothetical protein